MSHDCIRRSNEYTISLSYGDTDINNAIPNFNNTSTIPT